MDATIKERWLTALRSGDYKQGEGVLRNHDYDPVTGKPIPGKEVYCCLGVLCDIVWPESWHKAEAANYDHPMWDHDEGIEMPSDDLLAKVGLSEETAQRLANFNDKDHWTFAQIADWIADNLFDPKEEDYPYED